MALTRTAEAVWEGDLKDGKGNMSTESGAYNGAYNFQTRFGEEPGTNPEELLGAAHAGCFTMSLAGRLTRENFPPNRVSTTAKVTVDRDDTGFLVTRITLTTEADVPGIDDGKFQEVAQEAKRVCPLSRALAAVPEIVLEATLLS